MGEDMIIYFEVFIESLPMILIMLALFALAIYPSYRAEKEMEKEENLAIFHETLRRASENPAQKKTLYTGNYVPTVSGTSTTGFNRDSEPIKSKEKDKNSDIIVTGYDGFGANRGMDQFGLGHYKRDDYGNWVPDNQ